MISQRMIELINQELDAELPGSKSSRLYRQLEKNPEAQAYFDEMKRLKGILEHVHHVDPPASLKIGILNAVRSSRAPDRAHPSLVHTLIARITNPAIPRYGFAVASGICIGMLLFAVITGTLDSTTNTDQLSGAMGVVTTTRGAVSDYGVLDKAPVSSSVRAITSGQQVFVEAEVRGPELYELTVVFPSAEYSVVGVRRQAGSLESVRSAQGQITARIERSGRVIVEFERIGAAAPPVRIELRQNNDLVWEKALKTVPSD